MLATVSVEELQILIAADMVCPYSGDLKGAQTVEQNHPVRLATAGKNKLIVSIV